MEKKSVIILGNGFDRALNYPTSYSDFYNNSNELKTYANSGNKLCNHIINNINSDLWSDLENGLYEYSKKLTQEYGENNNEETQRFHNEFNELKDALFKYLDSISENPQEILAQSPVMGLNIEWQNIKPHYFTFNYSTTTFITASLNSRIFLNNDDSVNENKFIYQHGSIFDSKNCCKHSSCDIVLGIDPEKQIVEDAHSFLYKSKQNIHDLNNVFQLFNESQLFVIYGCSIGDSDMVYFKEIFSKKQKNKIFLIYGYGERLESIKGNIKKIYASYPQFEKNNKLIFLDVTKVKNTRTTTQQHLNEFIK